MTTRWGILGTGNIARQFAKGLESLPDAGLVAVGSRTEKSAQAFSETFGGRAHGSYEALAADPEVDAVYISTPHTLHAENSLLCLEHGKAVLCEKPFTLNAHEAERVIGVARAQRALFNGSDVDALFFRWPRPCATLVRGGRIGEVKLLHADFGFQGEVDPEHRLYNPALGGGALLDLGVYPVSLASFLLGTPTEVSSQAHLGETGVDEQNAVVLKHAGGALAVLSSTLRATTPQEALVMGNGGEYPGSQPLVATPSVDRDGCGRGGDADLSPAAQRLRLRSRRGRALFASGRNGEPGDAAGRNVYDHDHARPLPRAVGSAVSG